MKKVTLLGLVLVLLAFSVAPVMAAGPNNGHGNGANNGQGNGGGDKNQTKQQAKVQTRIHGRGRFSNPSLSGKGNHGSNRMQTPFYLQGTIQSKSTVSGTITDTLTISVTHGNAQVKQYIGSVLTLTVDGTAKIFMITQGDEPEGTESAAPTNSSTDEEAPPNRVPIDFARLEMGDRVAIHGNVVDDVFHATLITVYVKIGQPETETP